jgi:hypothetical protein
MRDIGRLVCHETPSSRSGPGCRPDHTIARFAERQERALRGLVGEVLALCADAGLVTVGGIHGEGAGDGAPAPGRGAATQGVARSQAAS